MNNEKNIIYSFSHRMGSKDLPENFETLNMSGHGKM